MSLGGYDAFDDPYAYKGTQTLKNRLGLRDPDLLEAFELEMTALRANEPLPAGDFNPRHYCRVHHHLFQDVYVWAGKHRTVRTSKGGNPFCFPEHIPSAMDKLFGELHAGPCFRTHDSAEFVRGAAHFLGELNAIHPFREGNGRAQLSFLALLGETAGFRFDLGEIRRETFLPAMIASYEQELDPLIVELARLLDNSRHR